MPQAKSKQELVAQTMLRYPDAGNRTIARVLHAEHVDAFPSINSARGLVQYWRGAQGATKQPANKEFVKPLGWQKERMPASQSTARHELHITGKHRILIISDLHVPYHDAAAVKAALDYGKQQRVDIVYINGDFADFYAVSRHDKDPTRTMKNEIEQCRKMLRHIRSRFPDARIIFKVGNHEDRMERFLAKNAPVLLGVAEFQIPDILKLNELNIEYVPSLGLTFMGRLPVYHGHELPQGMSSPVNPARGIWMRVQESMICGHWHRSSVHTEKVGVHGKVKSCWSLGCLCNMTPDYAPVNRWSHGFAIVDTHEDGNYEVDNKTIIEGVVR